MPASNRPLEHGHAFRVATRPSTTRILLTASPSTKAGWRTPAHPRE